MGQLDPAQKAAQDGLLNILGKIAPISHYNTGRQNHSRSISCLVPIFCTFSRIFRNEKIVYFKLKPDVLFTILHA